MTRVFRSHTPKDARRRGGAPAEQAPPVPEETAGGAVPAAARETEVGGPDGPEPTRYGDWERKGICVDF